MNFGYKMTPTDIVTLHRSDPLVHTEFQFSERYDRISQSSTMSGDDDGCRFKQIGYSHPEWWTNLILPMSDEQEDRAFLRGQELDGKKYDLIGLASFGTKWDLIKPHPDKLWCSEDNGELIKASYQWGDEFVPHFYHPVGLFFEIHYRIQIGMIQRS